MDIFLWILIVLICLLAVLEIGARVFHHLYFLMPFQARVIGEYPYTSFVVKDDSLSFRFKGGFRSSLVNTNRFGLRSPEPEPDGRKKRILVIGESDYFGPKLLRERDLWCFHFQDLLTGNGISKWEVINGGIFGYNAVQFRTLWESELRNINPEIMILRIGANEISQAYSMGSKWRPGLAWPYEFIIEMEKKSPKWQKIAGRFCIYFLLRRAQLTTRQSFGRVDGNFQWDLAKQTIFDNQLAIIEDARKRGIKVALAGLALSYRPEMPPPDQRSISALQSNWREFYDGWARYQFEYMEKLGKEFAPSIGVPFIDLAKHIWNNPRHFELFLDVVHWNAKGHRFIAEALYKEIQDLGWLEQRGES